MAHAGKIYKLQFRRDLQMQLNTGPGWAEAFSSNVLNVGGAKGVLILTNDWRPVNLLKDGQPPMIWTSFPYSNAGITWRLRLTLNDPLAQGAFPFEWLCEIIEQGVGVVITWRCPFFPGTYSGPSAQRTLGSVVVTPGYVEVGTGIAIASQAARWAVYP